MALDLLLIRARRHFEVPMAQICASRLVLQSIGGKKMKKVLVALGMLCAWGLAAPNAYGQSRYRQTGNRHMSRGWVTATTIQAIRDGVMPMPPRYCNRANRWIYSPQARPNPRYHRSDPLPTWVSVPGTTVGNLKSGLERSVHAYQAEFKRQQGLEDRLGAMVEGLELQKKQTWEQIESLKKYLLVLHKANDRKGMAETRKQIQERTAEYQKICQSLRDGLQKKPKITLLKNLAQSKGRQAEQTLQQFQKGELVAASTVNQIIQDGQTLARLTTFAQARTQKTQVAQKPLDHQQARQGARPIPGVTPGYDGGARPIPGVKHLPR